MDIIEIEIVEQINKKVIDTVCDICGKSVQSSLGLEISNGYYLAYHDSYYIDLCDECVVKIYDHIKSMGLKQVKHTNSGYGEHDVDMISVPNKLSFWK